MIGGNQDSDKSLLKAVNKRLERSGTQSRLTATVQRGSVTLRGKLQYENQRMTIVKAINSVSGVRNVVDQLEAPPKNRPQVPHAQNGGAAPPEQAPSDQPAVAIAQVLEFPDVAIEPPLPAAE